MANQVRVLEGVLKAAQSAMKIKNSYAASLAPIMKQTEWSNSINSPFLHSQELANATAALKTAAFGQEIATAFSEPLKGIQSQIANLGLDLIGTSIKPYYSELASSLAQSIKPLMNDSTWALGESIRSIVSSYQFDIVQKMQFPIQQMLQTIDFSPLYSILEPLKGFDLTKYRERLNKIVIAETYDARWFPHALCVDDNDMVAQFWRILDSTRKSKNRVKKIDTLVFETYTKPRIEDMKKDWRKKNIPEHKMRMMHQAVQAYHRKEYAITIVMLSTLWEGIIYDKANDTRGKTGKRTKEDFEKLMSQTEYDQLFFSFFDEYIMYDCRSVEDVKDDVPGRNSSAHSWYSKYPSRKAGLNAILFTDFLLDLEPMEEKEING